MRMERRLVNNAGKLVSLTNLLTNGNFASTSNWTSNGQTFTVSANEATFVANSTNDTLIQTLSITNGHKYYFCAWLKSASPSVRFSLSDYISYSADVQSNGGNAYEFVSGIHSAIATTSGANIYVADARSSAWDTINIKYVSCIDLTAAFGAGNEPSKAQMDALMQQFDNRWLNGTQNAL